MGQVQSKPVRNGKHALRKNDNRDREPIRSARDVYLATFSNRHISTSLQRADCVSHRPSLGQVERNAHVHALLLVERHRLWQVILGLNSHVKPL